MMTDDHNTLYIASYNTAGEDGVIGVYRSLSSAQEALDAFYELAQPSHDEAWEHRPAGQIGGEGREWPATWTLEVEDDEFATVTQVQLSNRS
jgi:hypothetical protein